MGKGTEAAEAGAPPARTKFVRCTPLGGDPRLSFARLKKGSSPQTPLTKLLFGEAHISPLPREGGRGWGFKAQSEDFTSQPK